MNEYLDLFLVFAKMGVMTFGGGMAMLPILQREIVEDRHWATEEELVDYYAIGNAHPGIIALSTRLPLSARSGKESQAGFWPRWALYSRLWSLSVFWQG